MKKKAKKSGRPAVPVSLNTLGGRLRAIREEKKITTQEAADAIGVSHSTWCRYESGARAMPTEMLFRIINKLEFPPGKLLGLKDVTNR